MSRAKLLRFSVRLANSLSSTRQPGFQLLRLNQVTHFSYFTQSPRIPHSYCISLNSHQNVYFSSKSESFIELILSNDDWSEEIENELEKMNPKLTHESVVYVLKKLNGNPQKSLDFFKWVRDDKKFELSYMPYSVLIKSLASNKDFIKELWAVSSEMKGKGFRIDIQMCGVINLILKRQKLDEEAAEWIKICGSMSENTEIGVVKDVVKVIMGSDWDEKVESELKKLKVPLAQEVLYSVIRKLRDEPSRALKFFEWVRSVRKYEHNSVTYSGMAWVLARRGMIGEFWDLVTRMRSEGYEIDSYTKISRFLRNEDAVKLFEFMLDSPYKPSEQDCTWLLKKLAHDCSPDISLVTQVANKYLEVGSTHAKAIYDCIHRSLCKVGRFDEAKKIVEDMRNAGYKPDNITYSQEVFGLCKIGRCEDAYLVLDQMEAEGCVPDIMTWTILIQGYCVAGQVDLALLRFACMRDKGLTPDADVLEVLINGFLSQNKLLGAYKLLVEIVDKDGVKPWQATYKLMIEKLLQDGKLEEASKLQRMMKEHDYPPYPEPFVKYISRSGTVANAKEFLRGLSTKDVISTEAYVHVITSFFEEGRHSEAKDLLYGSPHRVRNQKKIKKMFGSEQNS
ncbi:pentatricopeptide repeat-containing protein At3g48250, chloroplastic [Beta vulgaris subsp. vulgaris]|uniref:pentatricopeptide repeat-containing protein At3g48250, chloroplastic n=1 Tax=Beta vulgaris subsp. vulgaris TaxID=3555 RepID=UPI002548BC8E|nr:pentatricopeptide repeat-containing protein At3g48250, chloroplastic [Beta vulgaris subsp. vulgaris]